MKIKFGSTELTKIIDDEGSTQASQTNYHAGIISLPVYVRYKIKVRVSNQDQENAEYKLFSDELREDRSMLEPNWSIEHTKAGDDLGYYHVIKSYTRLTNE